ncbi:Glyoxalase-like domain protein [Pseudobythopirellula maris]|uniref:Glyoxalase-like domain protein n=1 Tax=Pseudobythopirellula maris TaxID=2527991 RepID=A0A5C5ZMQ0_9BACT|nr:VOC family protein [Pseudobythopirellula maris]TWT88257.1 Glyoxalase-like domain protein [Pseudobythopirellula maris]
MKIEHVAYQVPDPAALGEWYCEHLGFTVARSQDAPVPCRFLADETGAVMIEVYNNPKVTTPDYAAMDPLATHLAFVCEDLGATVERLVAAGATVALPHESLPSGDEVAMLRDPWGMAIQLCCRAEPMV